MNDADVTLYEDIILGEAKREEEKPETETTNEHFCQTSYCPPCSGEDQSTMAKRRESFMSSLFINVASFLDV